MNWLCDFLQDPNYAFLPGAIFYGTLLQPLMDLQKHMPICGVMQYFLMKTTSAINIYVRYSFSREKWIHFFKEGEWACHYIQLWAAVGVDLLHTEVAKHFSGLGLQSSVGQTFSDNFLYWKLDDNYHFWKSLDIFFFCSSSILFHSET